MDPKTFVQCLRALNQRPREELWAIRDAAVALSEGEMQDEALDAIEELRRKGELETTTGD